MNSAIKDGYLRVYSDLLWSLRTRSPLRAAAILRAATHIIPGVQVDGTKLKIGNYTINLEDISTSGDYDWWYGVLDCASEDVFPKDAEWLDDTYVLWELSNMGYAASKSKPCARICRELMLAAFSDI